MSFPKGFLFGTATAAAQVEGAAHCDGRGDSIWDEFARKPGKIHGGDTPETACDSYHQFDRDVANMKELGVNTYRMSISWSRVLPEGKGQVNQAGLDYYRRCVDKLKEAGIAPNVTLYHWDLPQALEEKGGWANRDTIEYFTDYARLMFDQLDPAIWATHNEPIATYVGYALGGFAPGHTNEKLGNQARHNLLVSHGRAVQAYRESGRKAPIGIVIDVWKRHPLTDSEADRQMVIDQDERNWKFYCDPVFTGRYSDYILNALEKEGTIMEIKPGDLEAIHAPIDYYGLNCYNRVMVSADQQAVRNFESGGNFQDNGTEFYPKAVYDAIHLIRSLYDFKKPIYVTESGWREMDPEAVDPATGIIEDKQRIQLLQETLGWIDKANEEGMDVRGYYVWSLMDNFEWSAGRNLRFGLMHTDFDKLTVTPKRSYYWYRDFIRSHI